MRSTCPNEQPVAVLKPLMRTGLHSAPAWFEIPVICGLFFRHAVRRRSAAMALADPNCVICQRADVARINEAIASGVPERSVCVSFSLTGRTSLRTHISKHTDSAERRLARSRASKRISKAASRLTPAGWVKLDSNEAVYCELERLYNRGLEKLDKADAIGAVKDSQLTFKEVVGLLGLVLRTRGMLSPEGGASITVDNSVRKIEMVFSQLTDEQLRALKAGGGVGSLPLELVALAQPSSASLEGAA